jgi:hypothetical protein
MSYRGTLYLCCHDEIMNEKQAIVANDIEIRVTAKGLLLMYFI